jgi:hypothetical protein
MLMVKVYDIDTENFDVPISKGKTIVKVILFNDFLRILKENNILFINQDKDVTSTHRLKSGACRLTRRHARSDY